MTTIKNFFNVTLNIKDIAEIHKKKKVFLYPFEAISKGFFNMMWSQDVVADGFIAREDQEELLGIHYLNRPIISIEDFLQLGTGAVLVDCCGLHDEKFKRAGFDYRKAADINIPRGKRLIAYGAGYRGMIFLCLAQMLGIDVEAVCDKDPKKQGKDFYGVHVISLEQLKNEPKDYDLVFTLDSSVASNVGMEVSDALGMENAYIFNYELYDSFDFTVVDNPLTNINRKNLVIHGQSEGAQTMRYYIHKAIAEGLKLILWGNSNEVALASKRLKQIDVPLAYCVTSDNANDMIAGLPVNNKYDIAYENSSTALVLVFRDAIMEARRFCDETGSDERMFCKAENHGAQPHPIWSGDCLDPVLGHNKKWHDSFSVMHAITKKSKGKPFRLGIVGASTSDMYLNPEISWPLQLLDIADEEGFPMEIYDGATPSYVVSQELIKLVRDISPLRPDLVISYSGVNHCSIDPQGEYFFSAYQKRLFSYFVKQRSENANYLLEPVVYYGHRWDSVGEFWLYQERLMHGICAEFGVKFIGIFQPWLYDKANLSKFDFEVLAHNSIGEEMSRGERLNAMGEIHAHVKVAQKTMPWLVDMHSLFDDCEEDIYMDACHLTTRGNRILAEKIFDLIKPYINK